MAPGSMPASPIRAVVSATRATAPATTFAASLTSVTVSQSPAGASPQPSTTPTCTRDGTRLDIFEELFSLFPMVHGRAPRTPERPSSSALVCPGAPKRGRSDSLDDIFAKFEEEGVCSPRYKRSNTAILSEDDLFCDTSSVETSPDRPSSRRSLFRTSEILGVNAPFPLSKRDGVASWARPYTPLTPTWADGATVYGNLSREEVVQAHMIMAAAATNAEELYVHGYYAISGIMFFKANGEIDIVFTARTDPNYLAATMGYVCCYILVFAFALKVPDDCRSGRTAIREFCPMGNRIVPVSDFVPREAPERSNQTVEDLLPRIKEIDEVRNPFTVVVDRYNQGFISHAQLTDAQMFFDLLTPANIGEKNRHKATACLNRHTAAFVEAHCN